MKRKILQIAIAILCLLCFVTGIFTLKVILQTKLYFQKISAQGQIETFMDALMEYKKEHGIYPKTLQELTRKNYKNKSYYFVKIINDPWKNSYIYNKFFREGKEYCMIISYGYDGLPGGNGANADIILMSK